MESHGTSLSAPGSEVADRSESDPETRSVAWRFPLAARLTVVLTGVAFLTLGAAALMQDRALSKGLSDAAQNRLRRSARTTERLAAEYLRERVDRYAGYAYTPELRASLELGDPATPGGLARSLARVSRATR